MANLDAPFSFVVFLGMLHYSLWEMPVRGRTVTRNLKYNYSIINLIIIRGEPERAPNTRETGSGVYIYVIDIAW